MKEHWTKKRNTEGKLEEEEEVILPTTTYPTRKQQGWERCLANVWKHNINSD